MILHCDSMTDLLRLAIIVRRPKTVLASVSWLSLNMVGSPDRFESAEPDHRELAQAGIAVLGLTYSATPGVYDIYRNRALGSISIPDLNALSPESKFQDGENWLLSDYGAHLLGDIGSSYNFSMLPDHDLSGKSWASNPAAFWNATDHWKYVSVDSALSSQSGLPNYLSIYTDRSIRSSGTCQTPNFIATTRGNATVVHTFDGNADINFPYESFENVSQPSMYYLTIPTWMSYFATDGYNVPCGAACGDCGQGCSNVKALETRFLYSSDGEIIGASGFYYYDCNITVVSETGDSNILDDKTGAIVAQAIALIGDLNEFSPSFPATSVYYLPGLTFGEPQNGSAAGMASLISRFAIGVVAAAAKTNTGQIVPGYSPMQGLQITLDHPVVFSLILSLTAGIQLLLVLVAAFLCRRLVVAEEVLLSHENTIRKRFVLGYE